MEAGSHLSLLMNRWDYIVHWCTGENHALLCLACSKLPAGGGGRENNNADVV